jgi:hypothetical protein
VISDQTVVSIFSLAMLPRARFLQGMLANTLAAGFGAAYGMLVVYSSVKARQHTTPARAAAASTGAPNASLTLNAVPYNAAASTVSAVYFFFAVSRAISIVATY